jgi:hypothetical protein|tara:strand:+ start:150 stop:326 length:177 start_codon:yes stop_codon:yes gene_type:complete
MVSTPILKLWRNTMMMMFVIGFALGLMTTAIGLLILLEYQDMKDLENRTGKYASTTKE